MFSDFLALVEAVGVPIALVVSFVATFFLMQRGYDSREEKREEDYTERQRRADEFNQQFLKLFQSIDAQMSTNREMERLAREQDWLHDKEIAKQFTDVLATVNENQKAMIANLNAITQIVTELQQIIEIHNNNSNRNYNLLQSNTDVLQSQAALIDGGVKLLDKINAQLETVASIAKHIEDKVLAFDDTQKKSAQHTDMLHIASEIHTLAKNIADLTSITNSILVQINLPEKVSEGDAHVQQQG
jgi:hypothetical protein